MRAREVTYSDEKKSGFYISSHNSFILIVPFGTSHVFDHLDLVEKEVRKLADRVKVNLPEIEVFIDLLPVAGNRKRSLLKFTFIRRNGEIDWFAYEEFSIEEAPKRVLEAVKSVYTKNKEVIIRHLLPSERRKFEFVLCT